ncbi:MAG: hypothetical protein H6737_26065 [Alphaproteobacteria bacterium]|nr:hypothetical protein [Alphaproteobacteria bacterium]
MISLFAGVLASGALWFFGFLWWVPVPILAALAFYEGFFWWRGDRAQSLRVDDAAVTLIDPLAPGPLVVPLDEVTVATLYFRQLQLGELELALVLGDDTDVRFAVRLVVRAPFEPQPHDIPADVYDVLFGGVAGLFRALAPAARRPRQTFYDPTSEVVRFLRTRLPPAVWRRTGLRLWPGMEPDIDLFGYYEAPHADWMVLDGHDWRRSGDSGTIGGWTFGASERRAVLFQGLQSKQTVERLPLALVNLGTRTTVAIPAPSSVGIAEPEPLSGDLLHTHAPEGAALVWHLLVHTPRDRWPPELLQMIEDRRPIRVDLDMALPG